MNKSDLAEKLAKGKGITRPVAERVIDTMFNYMVQTLIEGGRIEIRGLAASRSVGMRLTLPATPGPVSRLTSSLRSSHSSR